MHIYAFGSLCRGEVSPGSDVDLLALTEGHNPQFDPDVFSIYSYARIKQLWDQGNPFAWHLALEARSLFADDGEDFLRGLGKPQPYRECSRDCEKFYVIFEDAAMSLKSTTGCHIFDLATVFLSIRNIATCFSLGVTTKPDFSRNSARQLGCHSVDLTDRSYKTFERARVLCTRGHGATIDPADVDAAIAELDSVRAWMKYLLHAVKDHERVQ